VDLWHASPNGTYYFSQYQLRGKVVTDSGGYFEVLTITPGYYLGRTGHFHYIITPSGYDSSKYHKITTQSYVCKANNHEDLKTDKFSLWLYRKGVPINRLITSWHIPEATGGERIHDFPQLSEMKLDEASRKKLELQIKQWNDRLASLEEYKGEELKIVAGGYAETRLSYKY